MEYLSVFSNWCSGPGFWQSGGGAGGGWMMPFHFGGIFQLLIIGLIIYFTVRIFRKPTSASGPDSAETTLRQRFVNGEIDTSTYETMKEKLNKS